MSNVHYWNYPTEIFCGAHALSELPQRCVAGGMRNPLIVTDPGMLSLPHLAQSRDCLDTAGHAASRIARTALDAPA